MDKKIYLGRGGGGGEDNGTLEDVFVFLNIDH